MSNSILKNSIYNIASKGFNLLYPLITSAYISRIFHADGVGMIMYAINIVTYFSIAASLGVPNYAVKILAPLRSDKDKLNRKFSEIALIIFVSSLLVSIAYYLAISFIFKDSELLYQAGAVLGLIIISNITNYDWLFEAMEDYRLLAFRSIVVKTILLTLMFTLVRSREDIVIYCGIYAGISVLNNIWNLISYKKYVTIKLGDISVRSHIRPILFLFAAVFATEIYTLLDSTMLGVMCESSSLGNYSNASRIVRSLYGALFAVIAVFNPRLSKYYGIGDIISYKKLFEEYYDIGVMLSVLLTCILYFTSPYIIHVLLGVGFDPAIDVLRLLTPLVFIFTMATIFGHIPLVIYGKEKTLLIATIVGAVVNFGLNQALIPQYQHNGAAFASLVSEVLVTSVMIYFSMKVVKIPCLVKHNTLSVIISSIVMILLCCITCRTVCIDNDYIMLLLLTFVAVSTYVLMLIITHHDFVGGLCKKMHKKQ